MSDLGRQMARINQNIDALQTQLADVSAEYAELIHVLAPFLNRYQHEILVPHSQLVTVKRQIADIRALLGDDDARDPSTADTPLNQLVLTDFTSVQEQYDRAWKGKQAPSTEINLSEVLPPASDELKDHYKLIVAEKHPILSLTNEEKDRRREFISQVNFAYVRRNETALGAVADALRERSDLPAIVDEAAVEESRSLAFRLEQAVLNIEGQIFELRHGDVAKVRANAQIAHADGRDLIAELAQAIWQDLESAERQLEQLEQRLG